MDTNDPLNQLFNVYVGTVGPDLTRTKISQANAKTPQSFLYVNGFSFAYWPEQTATNSIPIQYQALVNGVTQLAGISHLGPALASLIEIYQANTIDQPTTWEADLTALLDGVITAEKTNSEAYWLSIDNTVLPSYASKMARMIDVGLKLVKDYLEYAAFNPETLNYDTLRNKVLNPKSGDYTFNQVMIGTFSLANLLVQYYSINWMQSTNIDWANCSVLLGGQFGRITGGLSTDSNTAFHRIIVASNGNLDPSKILIAPTAAAIDYQNTDPTYWTNLIQSVLKIWWSTESSAKLSPPMFPEYPTIFVQPGQKLPPEPIDKPAFNQFMERLKFALVNPSQELASATANFMVNALARNNFNPEGLFIPGMDAD